LWLLLLRPCLRSREFLAEVPSFLRVKQLGEGEGEGEVCGGVDVGVGVGEGCDLVLLLATACI
jgi:hypothetical protein